MIMQFLVMFSFSTPVFYLSLAAACCNYNCLSDCCCCCLFMLNHHASCNSCKSTCCNMSNNNNSHAVAPQLASGQTAHKSGNNRYIL